MTITIRSARIGDEQGIARVRVETWRTAYRGIVNEAHLNNLSVDMIAEQFADVLGDEQEPYELFAAETEQGEVVGFALAGPEKSGRTDYTGEVYAIYILEDCQGSGIGRRLMGAAAEALQKKGFGSMLVWILTDNPHRQFYEKLGGTRLDSDTIVVDGQELDITAYGWADISGLIEA